MYTEEAYPFHRELPSSESDGSLRRSPQSRPRTASPSSIHIQTEEVYAMVVMLNLVFSKSSEVVIEVEVVVEH